jgi:hypothetical protein
MKKLEKLTLKELEFKMTKIPQIIQEQLKGGDVTVTFDRSDSKIYLCRWYLDRELFGSK